MEAERNYAILTVVAKPGSKTDEVTLEGETISVRVRARPVDGAANDAIVRVLARAAGVAPSCVEIEKGSRGRTKRVRVYGLGEAALFERLRG